MNQKDMIERFKEWENNLECSQIEAVIWSMAVDDELFKSVKDKVTVYREEMRIEFEAEEYYGR